MTDSDFTYTVPSNFESNALRLIRHQYHLPEVASAFESCRLDHEDIGNAYYAGIRGDNWNMNALDFTIEGSERNIGILEEYEIILKKAFDHAIKSRQTGYQIHEIVLLPNDETEMLPLSNTARLNEAVAEARAVMDKILRWGEAACANSLYTSELEEDSFNDSLRDALTSLGLWEIRDQTRHGLSSSGLSAGEVDILVKRGDKEVALIEGRKLNSIDRSKIGSHIRKAVINYNPHGTPAFLLCYVGTSDFGSLWDKCIEFLRGFDFPLSVKTGVAELPRSSASVRVANMMLSRDGYDFPFYFIAFKLLRWAAIQACIPTCDAPAHCLTPTGCERISAAPA